MTKKVSGAIQEFFPHVYLLTASWDAIEKGELSEEGSAYSFLTAIIFTAFAIEAYLNEVSKEKFPNEWRKIERKSSREKLLKLCKLENYEIDLDENPFSTFTEIFDFRNSVVHAKHEKHNRDEIKFNERGRPIFPTWKILEKCNRENAVRYYDETEKMINLWQRELKVETISLISPERTTWWQSNVDSGENES